VSAHQRAALPRTSQVARLRTGERYYDYAFRGLLYLLALLGSLLFIAPFLFTVSSSLKEPHEINTFPPTLWPAVAQFVNYQTVFNIPNVPFATWYLNTVIIAVSATTGAVLSATSAAYAFSRFRWRGRDLLFMVLLSTLVLPEEVVIVPKFLMFNLVPLWLTGHSLIDTWVPLILPSWFGGGAFAVFLIRQFFLQIPRDLDDAARIDGASSFAILRSILLPLARPVLATVAIFAFLGHWNDFIHPLIYINSNDKYTLSVGLRWFQQTPQDPTLPRDHLMMAASILVVLPCVVIFFTMQRYFVQGIVMSGIKG
jgi:multiple sugar transport system permease protein